MSLDTYRKAMAISHVSSIGLTLSHEEMEEMALILATMTPGKGLSYSTEAIIDYVFDYGAWVREDNKSGEPILINGISETLSYLSHWEDTWPSELFTGKSVLDQDARDALQWLDDCGGTMAKENLPEAQALIDSHLAKEGPLDKFGRKTIVACSLPNKPHPFQNTTSFNLDDVYSWFETMPDEETDTIIEYVDRIREEIWNLDSCQEPVEYLPHIVPEEIENGVLDVDGDPRFGHSGFVLCNTKTYADIRKTCRNVMDIETRLDHIRAGIRGRVHNAVIIIRSSTELENGHIIFANKSLQHTCTYIPAT